MVFFIIDVVKALTDSVNPRDYWFKMKIRVKTEDGFELSTICRQLKMKAPDGKMRITDYWQDHAIEGEDEYAILTNIIHREWSGVSVKNHKTLKGLKTQNLRDHMSEAERMRPCVALIFQPH